METFKPLQVGEILRLQSGDSFRVWRIKGVHYSGMASEDLVTVETLDKYGGCAFGTLVSEFQVPIEFLKNIPHLVRT